MFYHDFCDRVQHVQPSPVYLTVPVQRYHKEKSSKADDEESGGQMKCYSIQTKKNNYKGYPSAIAKPKTRTKNISPCFPSSPETLSESS